MEKCDHVRNLGKRNIYIYIYEFFVLLLFCKLELMSKSKRKILHKTKSDIS